MAKQIPYTDIPDYKERVALLSKLSIGQAHLYSIEDDYITVPFLLGRSFKTCRSATQMQFNGVLTPEQNRLACELLGYLLAETKQSVLLTLYCGAGKTVLIIWLLAQLNLPVLIIVPRVILLNQWKERIATFCPTLNYKIQTPGQQMSDVTRPVVVLDEVHQLFTVRGLAAILKTCGTQYLIGATATPWRSDELNIFDYFFEHRVTCIRPPIQCHVKVIKTGLVPPMTKTDAGKLDWNALLNWQASNSERNTMIVNICKTHPKPQLILVKRIECAQALHSMLATSQLVLAKNTHTIYPETQYVIGTFAKLGTGFDCARLKTLVLASDVVEYFEQYAGRILRTGGGRALYIEILDDCFPLWKHYNERKTFYNSIHATFSTEQVA